MGVVLTDELSQNALRSDADSQISSAESSSEKQKLEKVTTMHIEEN
jgi:hypothetical protein